MSHFSAVDDSPDPRSLVDYFDRAATGLAAMKRYMATTVVRMAPGGLVLDLGCGAGHDLELLVENGFRPIGADISAVMLAASRVRVSTAPLVRATGVLLPFRDAAVDGCRIERVLMHTVDPAIVLEEVARVVRPGGFLTVFEPDWSSLTFEGDDDGLGPRLHVALSADVGGRLEQLVDDAGFRVLDIVTEDSRGYTLERVPTDVALHAHRVLGKEAGTAWLATQRAREAAGTFRTRWVKTLVVAMRASDAPRHRT